MDAKAAHTDKVLLKLTKLKDEPFSTQTGKNMWVEKVDYQIGFYEKLRRQIKMSHLDMWDEDVVLTPMTRELCHKLFQGFENDPDTFADMTLYSDYEYREEKVDAYFDRQQKPDRVTFAIMLGKEPIGEVKLKDIDSEKRECCLGIHLKNNSVKGRGFQILQTGKNDFPMSAGS